MRVNMQRWSLRKFKIRSCILFADLEMILGELWRGEISCLRDLASGGTPIRSHFFLPNLVLERAILTRTPDLYKETILSQKSICCILAV